ncbi:MAG: hypothetical protein LBR26_00585 [Prevotella sp.]|nr:hypothetical protein [Prevotella sp.]
MKSETGCRGEQTSLIVQIIEQLFPYIHPTFTTFRYQSVYYTKGEAVKLKNENFIWGAFCSVYSVL